MRAVVQRVLEAKVEIDGQVAGQINKGILVLLGIKDDDQDKDIDYIINKIKNLRIFEDDDGKMNISVKDIKGEILIVPNFTLYGDARKGARPSFMASGSVAEAENKYNRFIEKIDKANINVEKGEFQADMKVSLVNDGPVTILLDSDKLF